MTNNKNNLKARGTRILPLILAAATLAAVPVQAASVKCPKHPKARAAVSTTQPTCAKLGKKVWKCGSCGKTLKSETIKKKDHVVGQVLYKIQGYGKANNKSGAACFCGSYTGACKNCRKIVLTGTSKFTVKFLSPYSPYSVSSGRWAQYRTFNGNSRKSEQGTVSLSFARSIFSKIAPRLRSNSRKTLSFATTMTGKFVSFSHSKAPSGKIEASIRIS